MKELGQLLRFIGICFSGAALAVALMATREAKPSPEYPDTFIAASKTRGPQYVESWVNPTVVTCFLGAIITLVAGQGVVNVAEGRPFLSSRRRNRYRW